MMAPPITGFAASKEVVAYDGSGHRCCRVHRFSCRAGPARAGRTGDRCRQSQRLLRSVAEGGAAGHFAAPARLRFPPPRYRRPGRRPGAVQKRARYQPGRSPGGPGRGALLADQSLRLCAQQRGRARGAARGQTHAAAARSLRLRLVVVGVRRQYQAAFLGRRPHRQPGFAVRGDQEVDGGDQPQLRPHLRPAADRTAFLHRLRAVGTAGHGGVHLHPQDPRGRTDSGVQPWRNAAGFHLHRRYRLRRARLSRPPAGGRRRRQSAVQHRQSSVRGPDRLHCVDRRRARNKGDGRAAADAARRRQGDLRRHRGDAARLRLRADDDDRRGHPKAHRLVSRLLRGVGRLIIEGVEDFSVGVLDHVAAELQRRGQLPVFDGERLGHDNELADFLDDCKATVDVVDNLAQRFSEIRVVRERGEVAVFLGGARPLPRPVVVRDQKGDKMGAAVAVDHRLGNLRPHRQQTLDARG